MDIFDLQQQDNRKSDKIQSVLRLSQLVSITHESRRGVVGPHWGVRQDINELNKQIINK